MRKIASVAAGLGLAVGLAACSSEAALVNHAPGSSAAARTGDTLELHTGSGHAFDITLTQVADPAHGQGSATPHHNHRFVATLFKITNKSGEGVSGNAAPDANLVGSNGTVILPAKVSTSECSGISSKYNLKPGQTATACVSFEVQSILPITKVQFFPAAGAGKDYGEWLTS